MSLAALHFDRLKSPVYTELRSDHFTNVIPLKIIIIIGTQYAELRISVMSILSTPCISTFLF